MPFSSEGASISQRHVSLAGRTDNGKIGFQRAQAVHDRTNLGLIDRELELQTISVSGTVQDHGVDIKMPSTVSFGPQRLVGRRPWG